MKMRNRRLLGLMLACIAPKVSAQVNDTINGDVIDSANQTALADVQVTSEGHAISTKPDGSFQWIFPSTSSLRNIGSRPGFSQNGEAGLRFPSTPWFSKGFGHEARNAAGRSLLPFQIGGNPPVAESSPARKTTDPAVLPKNAATDKAHDLVFTKNGYATKTLSVPAGTTAGQAFHVKLARGSKTPDALESIPVPASGNTVAGKANLDKGEVFLLKAVGTFDMGTDKWDAEFGGFAAGGIGQDQAGGIDIGIDVGLRQGRVLKGAVPGRMKWFGGYRADHVYYMLVTGTGAPLSLKLIRPMGTEGNGSVTVSMYRISPYPQSLKGVLDSLLAPVTQQTVRTALTTDKATVYLLQAGGAGKVGGANLGLGDADYMDWDVNGGGQLDIGDLNVDYGLGVDESNTAQSPRRYWWGPWRKDHIYYTLFQGTGNTIGFTYYDSGYGDNSTTDKLTVRVLALP